MNRRNCNSASMDTERESIESVFISLAVDLLDTESSAHGLVLSSTAILVVCVIALWLKCQRVVPLIYRPLQVIRQHKPRLHVT